MEQYRQTLPFRERFWQQNQNDYIRKSIEIKTSDANIKALVRLYLPNTERGKEEEYLSMIKQSMVINKKVHGSIPYELNYFFLDSTERWNSVEGIKKVKGDRYSARIYAQGNSANILCFTPGTLKAETNHNEPSLYKTPEEEVQFLLNHELSHVVIRTKYKNGSKIEKWLDEGIAMLVADRYPFQISQTLAQRLDTFLQNYGNPPSNEVLMKSHYPGREMMAPVAYTYGLALLAWATEQYAPNYTALDIFHLKPIIDKRSIAVPKLLRNYFKNKCDFEKAFEQTFHLPYSEAYQQFKGYLAKEALKI